MTDSVKKPSEIQKISQDVSDEMQKSIVGHGDIVQSLMIALLTGGHVLIEGLPGTAKTSLAVAFAHSVDLSLKRIQATPDLMPGDITGTRIYNPKKLEFEFKSGPIFSNIVLVDEINRAPPRTQAALLEAMQETQVTVDGITSQLDQPFIVIATKNPIEFEGTFPLSPAQLDRFMSRLLLSYPSKEREVEILKMFTKTGGDIKPVVKSSTLISAKKVIQKDVKTDDDVLDYVAKVVRQTRGLPQVLLGASPTGSVALLNASKGFAAVVHGRDHVIKQDVKEIAFDVLNHRIVVKQEDLYSDEGEGGYGINKLRGILKQSVESV
ncbi:MAG: MoxR family ATPase [Thaumarchaeota archaeon]|nr:MoxR family ATPase [Nitrososphaerota archaeon]